MTLNQLRAFLVSVRTGTFTAAAQELHVAQASVSELIRRMEDECGLPLFVRGGRRLHLTTAGEELLPYAERAVASVDNASAALAAVAGIRRGTVSFGLLRNWAFYGLRDLAVSFHRDYPGVRLRIVGQSSTEVATLVSTGELEAGIVVVPIDDTGLRVTPLIRDELLYATADDAAPDTVSLADLGQRALVLYDASYGWQAPTRRQLMARAQIEGIHLDPAIEVERVEAALDLVGQGVGGTVVPAAIAHSSACPPNVGVRPFGEPMFDTIALIQRQSSDLSPAAAEMVRRASTMLFNVVADSSQRSRSRPPVLQAEGNL